jgi:hypothetical protein
MGELSFGHPPPHDVAEIDLREEPYTAVLHDGTRVPLEEARVAIRPGHGLTDAELAEVVARRALQGPHERQLFDRLARHHSQPEVKRPSINEAPASRAARRLFAREHGADFQPLYAPGTRIHRSGR